MTNTILFKPISHDIVFKFIFSDNLFLTDFVNEFFKFTNNPKRVKDVIIYSQNYLNKDTFYDVAMFCDIKVILDDNSIINIELYNDFSEDKLKKSLHYVSRLYNTQIANASEYKSSKKVISLNLIRGNYKNINDQIIMEFPNQTKDNIKLTEDFIDVILIKFDIEKTLLYDKNIRFHRLLAMLDKDNYEELEELARGDKIMETVVERLKKFMSDRDTIRMFNKLDEIKQDERDLGKNEALEQTAKNMLNEGIDASIISKCTGLSIKNIMML